MKNKFLKKALVAFACFIVAASSYSCSTSLGQQSPWKNSDSSWRAHILERLQHYNVPGASIAIIDGGSVVWSGGLGYRDNQKSKDVNNATLFQAASLSKLANAMLVMDLVNKGQITLDSNMCGIIGDSFCDGQPLTFRQLLSHTAGFNIHGFNGYPFNRSVPTEMDVLLGRLPATNPPVQRTSPIGQFLYSGGGILVSQIIIERIAKRRYDSLITSEVLQILGLNRSTYYPPILDTNCTLGYHSGIHVNGSGMVYPALAAGGLWTTAEDYAKLLIEILQAKHSHGKLLSSADVDEMLGDKTAKSSMGLGVGVVRKHGDIIINHSGAHEGYYSYFNVNLTTGRGIVLFFNSDEAEQLGHELTMEVMNN
jgi:CubicO group peptidase (beta-lactamase class C family)